MVSAVSGMPGHPELGAERALVYVAVARQTRVLRVQKHRQPEGGGVLHRPAHDLGVLHRSEPVGNADAAGFTQRAHFRKRFTRESLGQCPQHLHGRVRAQLGTLMDQLDHRRRVDHG